MPSVGQHAPHPRGIDVKPARERLMVAMDVPSAAAALALRTRLDGHVGWLKIGLRLFVAEGPQLVRQLSSTHRIFLDLKFHDIPNTVAEAVASAGELGVHMLNVHAAGGAAMLAAAARAARAYPQMQLVAVTVLTSEALPAAAAEQLVVERARLAQDCGLAGVVCSVHEVAAVKHACGRAFIAVTPGIRWGAHAAHDQQRIADPASAVRQGADYLVVGRPIIRAPDPGAAAAEVLRQMEAAG